jgi:putative ABC transport system permease protein
MRFVAIQMLTADRAKYLGLIFAVAFSTFLIAQQSSIFVGLMERTTSQIKDVQDAHVWVMDPYTQYVDEVKALPDESVFRVRGVPGVKWAVPLYKGMARAKAADGNFRMVILMGVDDATLVGSPHRIDLGSVDSLRGPDTILIDRVGYQFFFPNQPYTLGRTLEMNDRRVRIVGIFDSSAPFQNFPVFYARYKNAINYVGRERNLMSFILAEPAAGITDGELCRRIHDQTGLDAKTAKSFGWQTVWYYIQHTGIPVNFGITIVIALVVGTVVAGQTFYIFTIENLKYFGTLKAIGVSNWRILGMILLQALMVAVIGYSIGLGMTCAFFELTTDNLDLRGFHIYPEIAYGTAAIVLCVVILSSIVSVRRVLVLEPAVVFRG